MQCIHIFFFLFSCRFDDGKSDKEILDHLLKDYRYDKRLLPPVEGKISFAYFYYFSSYFMSLYSISMRLT